MSSLDPDTLPTPSSSSRPKGTPSITPRRFNRFWQPRQVQTQPLPKFRTALGSLDESDINQQPFSPQSLFSDNILPSSPTERFQDDSRKRKLEPEASDTEGDFKRPTLNLDDMPPLRLTRSSTTNLNDDNESKASDSFTSQVSLESLDSCRKATLVSPNCSPTLTKPLLTAQQSSFFKTSRGVARTPKKGNAIKNTQIAPEEPQPDNVC
jgi:hypothetical protein